jgi:hypothetical protein
VNLRHALLLTLATTPLSGCYAHCWFIPEEDFDFSAQVSVAELDMLTARFAEYDEELSCERICEHAYERDRGWRTRDVTSCALELPSGEGEAATPGTVTCAGRGQEYFCKGRRPLGHVEDIAKPSGDALGSTLAAMAHLEAASVGAFEQLAEQLAELDAPPSMLERCRAAAEDERNHARWLTMLAERHGAEVREPQLEAREHDRLAIAMHNAVEGCVHEAFAALVAAVVARLGESPVLRRIYARIAQDETRHGQLAWDLHAWFMSRLSPREQEQVETAQREALAQLPERVDWLARLPREFGSISPMVARQLARNFAATLATPRAA